MTASSTATTFTTSGEAFKYPLPTVRQFHKQLQGALDEKNARLRNMVGSGYRQLLGTAEMIVDMRRDIGLAEGKLGRVADGCGRSAVGRRVAGLGKLGLPMGTGEGRVDLGWVARMKALDGCAVVVGRLLKGKESSGFEAGQSKGTRLITASKVLVLSRLLIKSLGDDIKNGETGIDGAEDLLEEMKRKLGSLRRRLLRVMEKILAKIDGDRVDLVQTLCAYSLATSSGAKDVVRHFLHVRGEAMALAFEDDEEAPSKGKKGESILRALGLYTRTLIDVQALAPRQLSEALLGLKGKHLLKDDSIRRLEVLRLDICERWFGDEIILFTPYIRHDELDGPQAFEMLKSWSKKASELLLQGFGKTLGHIMDFKTVAELRTKIFESWIQEGGRAKGFDSSVMLDSLRNVVNDRLIQLLEARIAKLHLVGTEIEAVIDSWTSSATNEHNILWNDELLQMELSSGAVEFKLAVIAGVHGRDNSVSRVVKGYETWRHLIDELFTMIEQLKSQRWSDDVDSLEDDDIIEKRGILLSKKDPMMLQDRLDTCLEEAYKDLHKKIATLLTAHQVGENAGGIARFVLRVLRDIRVALPARPNLQSFGLSMIPNLHETLAASVSSIPMTSFVNSISSWKRVVGRALWEGSPELPVHPSPSTFKLLHSLTSSMTNAGSDLWSPTAVITLKKTLHQNLGKEWSAVVQSYDTEKEHQPNGERTEETDDTNGIEETQDTQINAVASVPEPGQNQRQEILIQSLFDLLILQHYLSLPATEISDADLIKLEGSMKSAIDLTGLPIQRLRLNAREYWKRTNLLFGFLA